MSIKISELLIEKRESGSTVKIFNEKIPFAKDAGCFFGILEIEHPGQNLLLDHAIGQFKNNLSKIINNKNGNTEEIFEQILQDVNQNLTGYIKEKNILIDFEKFNGVIAILNGKNLYFTYLGKITTILIHKIGIDNYKVIDILDTISGSPSKPTVFKIFSNIISGHIQEEDSLCFATANLLNFINAERIKELAVNCETDNAVSEIKNSLNKLEKNINFGAILLKLNLQKNKNSDKCDYVIAQIAENNQKKQVETKDNNEESAIIEPVKTIEKEVKEIEISKKPNKIAEKINKQINKTKNSFFSLKKISQFLLLIAVISVILFFQNVKNKNRQNLIIQEEKEYAELVETIENKLTQIKAKLIMNGKDEAKNIIQDVKTLISRLPKDKDGKIDELNRQNESYSDQTRNITKIDNPKAIAELANPALHLIKQKKALYLYNSNNSLYKLDLENNKIKVIANKIDDKGSWQKNASDVEEGKTLFLYDGLGISQYDFTADELNEIKIDLIDNARIDDLFFYGQKLYIMYGNNNQIFKHIKLNKNSFNSGDSWLAEDVDLSNAVSMAIDGNIWVLKNSGEIIKLFKGKKVDFEIKAIDPPLKNPAKIYTTIEMENIYIMEPSAKRIIAIDKLGNLLGQFVSDKFDNLLDFVLEKDENGKETGKIYLLNGMKIFEINVGVASQ